MPASECPGMEETSVSFLVFSFIVPHLSDDDAKVRHRASENNSVESRLKSVEVWLKNS